jgi:hypothetical protein
VAPLIKRCRLTRPTCLFFLACSFWTSASDAHESPPGPPPNLRGGVFQPVIERMWRDSPTFKEQCDRLAAEPQLRITFGVDLSLSAVRALGRIVVARNGRVLRAHIVLMSLPDTIELIAHEIEHVIERVEGVPLRDSGCFVSRDKRGGYESCRALDIGRRVAREVDESERRRRIYLSPAAGHTITGRPGRRVKNGVYGLGGVWLWNSDTSCNSSPSGYRPVSRCT